MLERAVRGIRSVRLLALLLTAALFAPATAPARAQDDAVPDKVRVGIEDVLKDKASKLADEKNSAGYGYKRGTYSKALHKVDDSTYRVAFFQDTIQPAEADSGRRVLTERFELTLKQDAAGKWSVAKEEKKDEFVGLYQGVYGGKWIYKFDSLSFEKEGLKVSSGPGYAYAFRVEGKNRGFRVFSDDMKFEYVPPPGAANMNYYDARARDRDIPDGAKCTAARTGTAPTQRPPRSPSHRVVLDQHRGSPPPPNADRFRCAQMCTGRIVADTGEASQLFPHPISNSACAAPCGQLLAASSVVGSCRGRLSSRSRGGAILFAHRYETKSGTRLAVTGAVGPAPISSRPSRAHSQPNRRVPTNCRRNDLARRDVPRYGLSPWNTPTTSLD